MGTTDHIGLDMVKPTDAELTDRFLYHHPDAQAIPLHERVSQLMLATAKEIRDICPEGRNLSLALTALEDARMRANAAIAIEGTAARARAAT